jgi:hypothetical protein
MPVQAYKTRILIDQFDFSGETSGGSLAFTVPPIDAPALQQAAKLAIPGNQSAKLEFSGYWNGGAAELLDNELYARLGTSTPCIVATCLDTSAVGNPAYVLRSTWGQQLKVDWPVAELLTASAAFEDAAVRGVVLAHQTFSATGAGSVIDLGAAVGGGWAVLVVRAIVGAATNASFLVQHAPTFAFSAPVTFGTFGAVSAAGAQAITLADPKRRYVRLNCADLGGATSIAVTAIVGVAAAS